MAISGNFPPSKVLVLAKTGQPTLTIQASTVWYIHADPDDPASMVVRYQDPLSPGSSNIVFGSFTGSADSIAASLGMFVKVTPVTNTSTFSNIYPTVPFWFNVCMFKDLNDRTSYRILRLGTANATESLSISDTYASVTAAINMVAADSDTIAYATGTPLGASQITARQIAIQPGVEQLVYRVSGTSSPANNGVRIEALNALGAVVEPELGTTVTVYNNASVLGSELKLYPSSGMSIQGLANDAPWPLDNGAMIVLVYVRQNIWRITNNNFGNVILDSIVPNDTTAQIDVGESGKYGQGMKISTLTPSTPALPGLSLGVVTSGLLYNIGLAALQAVNGGQVTATFMSNSVLQIGGAATGEEGRLFSKSLVITADDTGPTISPARIVVIDSASGVAPFIQFNGGNGDEMYIFNLSGFATAVDIKPDGVTSIGTVADGDKVHLISYNGGIDSWSVVSNTAI